MLLCLLVFVYLFLCSFVYVWSDLCVGLIMFLCVGLLMRSVACGLFVCRFACFFVCLFVGLFVQWFDFCSFVWLFVRLVAQLFVFCSFVCDCLLVHLFVCMFVYFRLLDFFVGLLDLLWEVPFRELLRRMATVRRFARPPSRIHRNLSVEISRWFRRKAFFPSNTVPVRFDEKRFPLKSATDFGDHNFTDSVRQPYFDDQISMDSARQPILNGRT